MQAEPGTAEDNKAQSQAQHAEREADVQVGLTKSNVSVRLLTLTSAVHMMLHTQ